MQDTTVEAALSAEVRSLALVEPGGDGFAPDEDLLQSGVLDSMGVMQLVAFMEDELGVRVADDEILADNFRSLDAMTQYVARKRGPDGEADWGAVVRAFLVLVEEHADATATVLVASHGDDDLVAFRGPTGWHFPRDASGQAGGYHPADGAAAIAHLEELRAAGATHLAFPDSERWWLEHYPELAEHLRSGAGEVAAGPAGTLFRLEPAS